MWCACQSVKWCVACSCIWRRRSTFSISLRLSTLAIISAPLVSSSCTVRVISESVPDSSSVLYSTYKGFMFKQLIPEGHYMNTLSKHFLTKNLNSSSLLHLKTFSCEVQNFIDRVTWCLHFFVLFCRNIFKYVSHASLMVEVSRDCYESSIENDLTLFAP